MAISRIPGFSLLSNLDRQGIDLQFTTNSQTLAYLDFANYRLGVNTTTPQQELEVVGNILVTNGHVYTSGNLQYDLGSATNWWDNVYANVIVSSNFAAEYISGTLITNAQPNITSLGTLTGLSINGNLSVSQYILPSGNLTGSIGSVTDFWNNIYANSITATGYYGTILTGNQPNITNLANVTVESITIGNVILSGNVDGGTISANTIYQAGYQVLDSNTIIALNGDIVGDGTYGNIYAFLVNTGVTPGVYGSADDEFADRVPKITVDAKGRITNIANVTLTQVGNISIIDTTISSNSSIAISSSNNGNILIDANGEGTVQIVGADAMLIPTGNTASRPSTLLEGYLRFNTDTQNIEWYDGTQWGSFQQGQMTSQVISPDGITDTYTLSANASTYGVIVSINGTLQQPATSYNIINNNQIQFTEIPITSDVIEVRQIGFGVSSVQSLVYGEAEVVLNNDNINVTGNIIPTVDDIYDIGSPTRQWKNIYLSGEVISTSANTTISSAGVATTVDTYDKTVYRTAKYVVQAEHSTDFESYEVLVTHNGTNAYRTTYGIVTTGNTLGGLTTTISGANVLLQYTATYTNTIVRLSKNYLAI